MITLKSTLATTFILFSLSAKPQTSDSLKRVYNTQTIYRNGNMFLKGNEKLRFNELKMEFKTSELGMADYNRAKTYKTIGAVSTFATLATLLATPSLVRNNTNQRNGVYTVVGLQFVFTMLGSYCRKMANDLIDRALWQRNKDVLFTP